MTINGVIKTLHQVNKIRYRPALIFNIAKAYYKTLILKQSTLRICEFSINTECQSKCTFCYASKFKKQGQMMLTVQEIAETWKQARELGAFSSVLFGGEPLLHPNFLEIIEILEPKKHIVTFATNAIALNEKLIIELKKLGVFLINISINSLCSELNDSQRGYVGHYDKVMEGIKLCKKHGLEVFLPIVTAKPYFQETLKLIDFADRNGLGATINLMCPMGREEGKQEELFDVEFWTDLRKLYQSHPNLRSDYDVNLTMKIECPAGFEKVHIGPYGDITGCSMNPVGFGNIRETQLKDIISKMRMFRHYKKRSGKCIVAVDKEYIEDYMNYASKFEYTPYSVEKNPRYQDDSNG